MRRNDLIWCVVFLALVCACAWLLWGVEPEPVIVEVTPTLIASTGTATATARSPFTTTPLPSFTPAPTCTRMATVRPSSTPVPTATRRPVATKRPTHEPYEGRETPFVRSVLSAEPDCLCLVDGRFVWCECQ